MTTTKQIVDVFAAFGCQRPIDDTVPPKTLRASLVAFSPAVSLSNAKTGSLRLSFASMSTVVLDPVATTEWFSSTTNTESASITASMMTAGPSPLPMMKAASRASEPFTNLFSPPSIGILCNADSSPVLEPWKGKEMALSFSSKPIFDWACSFGSNPAKPRIAK